MGKNKLTKFAEMEQLRNVFQPTHEEVFRTDYRLKGRWGELVFGNEHPIVLEVGCGKGEYTVGLAEQCSEKNFIGLDIKGARMWSGAKQAQERGLQNVAFLRTHAEELESVFGPGEIAEIWITFPDPQMAKSRKRLTGTRFLHRYQHILTPNGRIHLKTDSPFLYRYTQEVIRVNQLPLWVKTDNLYASDYRHTTPNIQTFYEQQWLSRGKSIKYLQFSLGENPSLAEPTIELEKDDYHSEARFMSKPITPKRR